MAFAMLIPNDEDIFLPWISVRDPLQDAGQGVGEQKEE
jgi:hypothetical protein